MARGSGRGKVGGVLESRRCGRRELTSVLRAKLYLLYIEFGPVRVSVLKLGVHSRERSLQFSPYISLSGPDKYLLWWCILQELYT